MLKQDDFFSDCFGLLIFLSAFGIPNFSSKRDLQKLVRCDCFGGVLAKESFPAILGLGQQSNFTATWQVLLHGRYLQWTKVCEAIDIVYVSDSFHSCID